MRIHYANGVPAPLPGATSAAEDFLTGFLIDNDRQFGRPTGLVVDGSGALLVADDTNGIISVSRTARPTEGHATAARMALPTRQGDGRADRALHRRRGRTGSRVDRAKPGAPLLDQGAGS